MVKIPNVMEMLGSGGPKGLDPTDLRKFLRGSQRNANIRVGPYDAYVRKSMPRGMGMEKPFDLARIDREGGTTEKLPPETRGPKGRFRELMALLESEAAAAGHDSVYVEQIMNKFLPEVLASMGYEADKVHAVMNPDTPSMFKRLRRP